MVACEYNHIDIIRILLSSGTSIDLINDNGYSALDIAHIRGHGSILNTWLIIMMHFYLRTKLINCWNQQEVANDFV